MAPIVAPTICRYAVQALFNSRPVVNILDMHIDTTGSSEDRETAIFDQAGIILNEWDDRVLPLLTNQYVAQKVSWVDLNSLSGTTGERSDSGGHTWPQPGGSSDGSTPGNVAYRVNKQTSSERGARQGRMYLCGVGESANENANGNEVHSTIAATMNTMLDGLLPALNQTEGGPSDFTSALHVVHTVDGAFSSSSEVVQLVIDAVFGSQRRRLRG